MIGFYVWSNSRPWPDHNSQMFALSRAVCALAPRPKVVAHTGKERSNLAKVSELRRLGRLLIERYGHVIAKTQTVLDQQHKAAQARHEPFLIPSEPNE